MKMKQKVLRGSVGKYVCFFSVILIMSLSSVYAQEYVPREFNPEEFISLSREITMDAALEIINQLSTKYENKMIIDPDEHRAKSVSLWTICTGNGRWNIFCDRTC